MVAIVSTAVNALVWAWRQCFCCGRGRNVNAHQRLAETTAAAGDQQSTSSTPHGTQTPEQAAVDALAHLPHIAIQEKRNFRFICHIPALRGTVQHKRGRHLLQMFDAVAVAYHEAGLSDHLISMTCTSTC